MVDVPEVRSLLARAFFHDPMFAWMFPQEAIRLDASALFFGLLTEFYSEFGSVETVASAENENCLAGVALTRVSARDEPYPRAQTLPSLRGYLAAVLGSDRADAVFGGLASVDELAPAGERYVYLNTLGVEPQSHGHGYGSSLLTRIGETANASQLPVHLETTNPDNVGWYEKYGFAVRGTMRLGDGPKLWAMTRQPVR